MKSKIKMIKVMKKKGILNLTYFVEINTSKGECARYYPIILMLFNTSNTLTRNRLGIYSLQIMYRRTMLR